MKLSFSSTVICLPKVPLLLGTDGGESFDGIEIAAIAAPAAIAMISAPTIASLAPLDMLMYELIDYLRMLIVIIPTTGRYYLEHLTLDPNLPPGDQSH